MIWRRFRRSKLAVIALIYVLLVALIAVVAPMITADPNAIDLASRLSPPNPAHPLGTDDLGRDVYARLVHGARVSLTVGFSATVIALVIGSLLGALAGYYGGAADWIVSR